MQERLPAMAARGTELRDLVDEVERLTASVDGIEPRAGVSARTVSAAPPPAAGAVYPGPWTQRPRLPNGRGHRSPGRPRHGRRWQGPFRGNARPIAAGIGATVLLTALAALSWVLIHDRLNPPESAALASPAERVSGTELAVSAEAGSATEPTSGGEPQTAPTSTPAPTFTSTSTPTTTPTQSPTPTPQQTLPSSVAEERAALGQQRPQ
jgi:hypothetical protein